MARIHREVALRPLITRHKSQTPRVQDEEIHESSVELKLRVMCDNVTNGINDKINYC